MSQINIQIPQAGQPNSTEDPKVASGLSTIQGVINGGIDASNITDGSITGTDIAAGTITPDKLTTGAGAAPFLKLLSSADKKIAWGQYSTAGWGGTNGQSGSFAHGMGTTPSAAILCSSPVASQAAGGANVPAVVSVVSWDSTSIYYQVRSSDGGNSNGGVTIVWLAFT